MGGRDREKRRYEHLLCLGPVACGLQVTNTALDTRGGSEAPIVIPSRPSGPFVGLAFKLEEGRWAAAVPCSEWFSHWFLQQVRGGRLLCHSACVNSNST